MKKKIWVLQFRTDKSLYHERDCIVRSADLKESEILFFNLLDRRGKLPEIKDLKNCRGLILGGSGQIDISHWSQVNKTKILRIEPLLKEVVKRDIPTLNICFGHQLLSYILGSRIEADQNQAETGTYEVSLSRDGIKSLLFKGLSKSFYVVEGHKDSVMNLPKCAKILASSDKCVNQSYQLKNNIYSVQFHPELDKSDVKFRLNLFPRYAKGKNVNEELKNYKSTLYTAIILTNFINYIAK